MIDWNKAGIFWLYEPVDATENEHENKKLREAYSDDLSLIGN